MSYKKSPTYNKLLAFIFQSVVSEAPSHGVPILIYDKLCAGSKSYSSFTEEFLKQENIMESAA